MFFIAVGFLVGLLTIFTSSTCGEYFCSQYCSQDESKDISKQNVVFVDSDYGVDQSDCSLFPCRTLEYALKQRDLKSAAFNITLLSQYVPLTSVMNVTSDPNTCTQFSIIGRSGADMTHLPCNNRTDSGVYISGMCAVTIENVVFEACGWRNFNITTGCDSSAYYMMAISLYDCANITITNVIVQNSSGLGLALFNAAGSVSIVNSRFMNNSMMDDSVEGGGGILIQANFETCNLFYTRYEIHNCTFEHNKVTLCDSYYNQGGGIKIFFDGHTCHNYITVADSVFSLNEAKWGGGLYSQFTGNVSNNSIIVKRCEFISNRANMSGGGSNVGYFSKTNIPPPINKANIFKFKHVNFRKNSASYGGGSSLFSSHGENVLHSNGPINFTHCAWTSNTAYFSSAVDIAPYVWDTLNGGYLPSPVFKRCRFAHNTNVERISVNGTTGYKNIGSFTATSFTIHFYDTVEFLGNSHSALCLMSSTAIFHPEMHARFINNSGMNGGGISMTDHSLVMLNNDSVLEFHNNTAILGGAISYFSDDQHDYVSSRSCFIQFQSNPSTIASRENLMPKNITFVFKGNSASVSGNVLYATSLWPCYYACRSSFPNISIEESLKCAGQFNVSSRDIGTLPDHYSPVKEKEPIYVIPGMPHQIEVDLIDEVGTPVTSIIFQTILHDNSYGSSLCNGTQYASVPTVCVEGQLSNVTNITIQIASDRIVEMNATIATSPCPPGYVFDDNRECGTARICVCSALCKGHTYAGIEVCNSSSFQAFVGLSTWVGYYPDGSKPDENNLYTAPCVSHLCVGASQDQAVILPLSASNEQIEKAVCTPNRRGFLCAQCAEDTSAYYHSLDYTCGNNTDDCQDGAFFYIISEIAPLTVLFSIAVAFDVRFTSGSINGFVLFCQIFNSFDLTAGGRVKMPYGASQLNDLARIVYGFFNLDFFSHKDLHFCIWKGAAILDVLSFKYVTTLYAFGLVMMLILVVNYCSCITRISGRCCTKKVSFLHGLSAFLVLCYGQCAQVTCAILLPVVFVGKNGARGPCMSKYGGVLYFEKEHLRYAAPACLAAGILMLPPLALILNPFCNKALGLLPCSGSPFSRALTLLCAKPKPFLDSFQGCFKDQLRFFAGLYFVYRLLPASVYMFVTTPLQGYVFIESFLVSLLLAHAVFQPYISRTHNVLDGLLFAILVTINSFTLFNFSNFSDPAEQTSVIILCWSQVLLSYIPLCYITWYTARSFVDKCRRSTATLTYSSVNGDMGIITSDRLDPETSRRKFLL